MTAPILPSRRHFIRQLATGSAALSSSMLLSACGGGDGDGERRVAFVHGVASGDPLADRVILWTRATPDRSGRFVVDWEVARDVSFAQIVARGSVETSEQQDFTSRWMLSGCSRTASTITASYTVARYPRWGAPAPCRWAVSAR